MGRKAGIALSAIGLIFIILALGITGSVFSALHNITAGAGLGGLAVIALLAYVLAIGGVFWLIGMILYLAAFLTSRGVTSKAIGSLFIIGGLLHFIFLIISASAMSGGIVGPSTEMISTIVIFLVLPIIIGSLMIAGGIKRIR